MYTLNISNTNVLSNNKLIGNFLLVIIQWCPTIFYLSSVPREGAWGLNVNVKIKLHNVLNFNI
jgi:hypothetical protein